MSSAAARMLQSVVAVGPAKAGRWQQRLREIAGEVHSVNSIPRAMDLIGRLAPQLVLVWERETADELERFLREARAVVGEAPVIVISSSRCVDNAVRFIRAGASDYLPGPLEGDQLEHLLAGLCLERAAGDDRAQRLFCEHRPLGVEVVGKSPAIVNYLQTIRLVAESRCNPVLILGETGTGKELAARSAHWWRYGDFERFVPVNCATLNANLLESELFGHVKGAFTGADRDKVGLFETAADGSLFLDEISEMPLGLQAKLLRVVQEGKFRRVGGTRDLAADVTLIASSNKNLLEEVNQGRFRRDLYYRLAVFPIVVPPLRHPQRRADIPLLAEYFLAAVEGGACPRQLDPGAHRRLVEHDWPGNVRELRNVIERASILERSGLITPSSLVLDHETVELSAPAGGEEESQPRREDFSLETAEREFIVRALKETGWQRTRAAALLGITRATLHAKLKRYDIQPPARSAGDGESALSENQTADA